VPPIFSISVVVSGVDMHKSGKERRNISNDCSCEYDADSSFPSSASLSLSYFSLFPCEQGNEKKADNNNAGFQKYGSKVKRRKQASKRQAKRERQ
jgi:hypothetical protein